jgi:endo-1,4-beta-xylanase
MMFRRQILADVCASLVALPLSESGEERLTLRAAAATRNIVFGTEVTAEDLSSDPKYADLVAQECAIVTPGIEAKWASTEPREGVFQFGKLDQIAAFAATHRLRLHMHNLIWSVALPRWTIAAIADGKGAAIIARHMSAVVNRYRDLVESWDVINEPVDPRWPSGPEGLCLTPWRQSLGPGYLALALRDAASFNSKICLMINDDDLEYAAPDRDRKREIYLRIIEALKKQEVPLHGFGLEAHLKPWLPLAEKKYRSFLSGLSDFGLKVYVTELDVCDRYLPADVIERDRAVADFTKRYLDIVLDEPAVGTVITWGLSDRSTWMRHDPSGRRNDQLAPRPLPYDAQLSPKPMRGALIEAFRHARMRPA